MLKEPGERWRFLTNVRSYFSGKEDEHVFHDRRQMLILLALALLGPISLLFVVPIYWDHKRTQRIEFQVRKEWEQKFKDKMKPERKDDAFLRRAREML